MGRLRSYARLKRQSDKVKREAPDFRAVYLDVDRRSEGMCEVWQRRDEDGALIRCTHRAHDHHHLFRPRRSFHDAQHVLAICRADHDRTEWPYARGRLVYIGSWPGKPYEGVERIFLFQIMTAKDKFAVRGGSA